MSLGSDIYWQGYHKRKRAERRRRVLAYLLVVCLLVAILAMAALKPGTV